MLVFLFNLFFFFVSFIFIALLICIYLFIYFLNLPDFYSFIETIYVIYKKKMNVFFIIFRCYVHSMNLKILEKKLCNFFVVGIFLIWKNIFIFFLIKREKFNFFLLARIHNWVLFLQLLNFNMEHWRINTKHFLHYVFV